MNLQLLAVSAVLPCLALPLVYGTVKPNPFYGFRWSGLEKDEALWYSINGHCGWGMCIASALSVLVSLFSAFLNSILFNSPPTAAHSTLGAAYALRAIPKGNGYKFRGCLCSPGTKCRLTPFSPPFVDALKPLPVPGFAPLADFRHPRRAARSIISAVQRIRASHWASRLLH